MKLSIKDRSRSPSDKSQARGLPRRKEVTNIVVSKIENPETAVVGNIPTARQAAPLFEKPNIFQNNEIHKQKLFNHLLANEKVTRTQDLEIEVPEIGEKALARQSPKVPRTPARPKSHAPKYKNLTLVRLLNDADTSHLQTNYLKALSPKTIKHVQKVNMGTIGDKTLKSDKDDKPHDSLAKNISNREKQSEGVFSENMEIQNCEADDFQNPTDKAILDALIVVRHESPERTIPNKRAFPLPDTERIDKGHTERAPAQKAVLRGVKASDFDAVRRRAHSEPYADYEVLNLPEACEFDLLSNEYGLKATIYKTMLLDERSLDYYKRKRLGLIREQRYRPSPSTCRVRKILAGKF